MELFIFVLVICVIVLFVSFQNIKNDNTFLKSILEKHATELSNLKKEIEELKTSFIHKPSPSEAFMPKPLLEEVKPSEFEVIKPVEETMLEATITVPTPIEIPVSETKPITEETQITELPILSYESHPLPKYEKPKSAETVSYSSPKIEKKEEVESAFSIFLKKAEKQFADNWTGILGTAIMVLGFGYLSIYTALKVAPLFRVLILWLYAGLLIGSHYFLAKKEKWHKTGLWLRSAGASLFLFGCFGASQIEPLTFIHQNLFGYSLIGLGIALNLFVGYVIKQQSFLSLHVVLSLLILCVIPEKLLVTFILAAITSTIGIALSYKEKWEYHLLIVIVAFIIFDIWFNAEGTTLSATENIFAILGIVMVSASCMFMQYRSVYENTRFDKTAFFTHLTNWILFAIGLILHSTGSHFKTFIVFVGAIICFLMAIKARQKKIFWLYNLDGMVAFILCSLSVIMLNDWNVGVDIIGCLLYVITLVCLFVVYQQKEALLYKIFLGINHFIAVILIIFSALMVSGSLDQTQITSDVASLIAMTMISLVVPVFTAIKTEYLSVDSFIGEKSLSLNGLLSLMFSLFVFLKLKDTVGNSFYYAIIGLGLLWCVLKRTYDSKTFDVGRLFFLALNIVTGIILINTQEKSYADWTFTLGLFAVIGFNWSLKRFYNTVFLIPFLCILGSNVTLIALSYKYLTDYTVFHVFSLFSIAILNHEFFWYNFKKKSLDVENENFLYFFYYFTVFLGSAILLWNASALTNIEIGLTCLGISLVEIYVLFAQRIKNKLKENIKDWNNLNLLNSELLLFNALLFGFSCLQTEYSSVFLSTLAIIAVITFQQFEEFKRYYHYSFMLIIGSVVFSIYQALDYIDVVDKTILYITEVACIFISIGYYYLLTKTEKEENKLFTKFLPYIQNLWIIVLLFIQVEFKYLPLVFMGLALLNFWLITSNKIKTEIHFTTLIGFLGIIVSVFFSINKLNSFEIIDWALQLASVALGIVLVILLSKKEADETLKSNYQIVLNIWLSIIMFSQLEHKWLPVFWATTAILNLYLHFRKISPQKNISIVYYLLANLHLGIISFHFYETNYLAVYLLIFTLLGLYIYLAFKWMDNFNLKNSLLIYPATISIGGFLYLSLDKGALTFFWILEALGLAILGILLKEKYFRYVSLSLVGLCVLRLMFFDLSNTDFLIRALVLLGVGVVLLVMNSLFKKYKDRFD
jgi:hypothetical protein